MSDLTPEDRLALEGGMGEVKINMRIKARADPIYLGSKILGYDYLETPADFHVECSEAMQAKDSYMMLAPRGHIKTTLSCVVGSIWEYIQDPVWLRLLIMHWTLDNAKAIGKEAMGHIRNGKVFRTIFPELCPQKASDDPTILSFVSPLRKRVMKEPTISVGAPGATKTGMHYDVIKASDLVNEQNVPAPIGKGSYEAMAAVGEFFRTFAPLLDQTNEDARVAVDGTRWHDADMYRMILEDEDGAYSHFRKIIRGIEEDADGVPQCLWPIITQKTLIQKKAESGSWLWNANYGNSPLPSDATVVFKREWFKTYTELPCKEEDVNKHFRVAITVDPAISEKTSADNTAIIVSGVEIETGHLYVLARRVGRFSPSILFEHLYDLDAVWKPDYIGIEDTAFQKALWTVGDLLARRHMKRLHLRPLKSDSSKTRRASILMVHAERYSIYVRPEDSPLVDEFVKFPAGKYDDQVDALSYRGQDLLLNHIGAASLRTEKRHTVLDMSQYKHTGQKFIDRAEGRTRKSSYSRFNVRRRSSRWPR